MSRSPERSAVELVDKVRSFAPGAFGWVDTGFLRAIRQVTIVDVTHPQEALTLDTGGSGEPQAFFVRPAGLGRSGGEMFEIVPRKDVSPELLQSVVGLDQPAPGLNQLSTEER